MVHVVCLLFNNCALDLIFAETENLQLHTCAMSLFLFRFYTAFDVCRLILSFFTNSIKICVKLLNNCSRSYIYAKPFLYPDNTSTECNCDYFTVTDVMLHHSMFHVICS